MARADDDSWGVTHGVGATALGVALARAAETARPDRLFEDPCAQLFIDAAATRGWRPPAGPMAERIKEIGDYAASRTKWFDDFFTAASADGVRQAVIVAAGLDARAYRLKWAAHSVVYEIDQPEVLRFKNEVLSEHGVSPTAGRCVAVAVDLRQDWPTALREAGFDPAAPSAWSAEGLLPYLPAAGQDLLFERIDALSAPGSRIGVESFGKDFFDPENLASRRRHLQRLREEAGVSSDEAPDIEDLWFVEERTDVAAWLAAHGWDVSTIDSHEMMQRYRGGEMQNAPRTVYVEARR